MSRWRGWEWTRKRSWPSTTWWSRVVKGFQLDTWQMPALTILITCIILISSSIRTHITKTRAASQQQQQREKVTKILGLEHCRVVYTRLGNWSSVKSSHPTLDYTSVWTIFNWYIITWIEYNIQLFVHRCASWIRSQWRAIRPTSVWQVYSLYYKMKFGMQ